MNNFTILIGLAALLSSLVQLHVPGVYMDEIFHYNQTLSMHEGNLTYYDPKITTPPGLYLLVLVLMRPLPFLNLGLCRATNVLLGLLLARVLRKLNPRLGLTLGLFPPSFFFNFLFYTDTLASLLVLAALQCALPEGGRRRGWAAGYALLSLSLRQTNVVWTAFIAGICLLDELQLKLMADAQLAHPSTGPAGTIEPLNLEVAANLVPLSSPITVITLLGNFLISILMNIPLVIRKLWGFLVVVLIFIGFLIWNEGSIALGDKGNHTFSLHLPQLLYFSAFTCAFGFWGMEGGPLKILRDLPTLLMKSWLWLAISIPMIYWIIENFTIAHPFLLADNRHYTFYLWRYILSNPSYRLALTPLYSICILLLYKNLDHKPFLWILIFLLALSLTLVPSPLIEFRYYLIPYFILRLNFKRAEGGGRGGGVIFTSQNTLLWMEVAWYSIINLFTFYMFIWRPFQWPSEPWALQRFMW